ncbi:MAG TPA: N-acetyl-alpha-D-glucosaminyl L-malate synthase BshA [Gemmatimonadaceae bacterium]|jgi:N-acetyl-alpha-D-glucosaminyl L-malate synthase BshA|nr:N-acetyl-alpha-D-glucosaminyl L-malate synthase BshA [Gemmatimonadaceae bacterium]
MNIGIVCYASIGGSGVIASELGKTLAARGHRVHILSSDTPFRLADYQPGLSFHRVQTPTYPLFREPQYVLSLANKIVQVARAERLDIIHAHYAIPHATAAYLARQILASSPLHRVPTKVITTLHGTDITLLGSDPSYSETVAFCIQQSDGVTAVSESLKADTRRELGVDCEIRVIPNFLDCSVHRRIDVPDLRSRFARDGQKVVIHVSNFRPVKRVVEVVEVFARIRREVCARLLMVGDGPDMGEAVQRARTLGVADDVLFLGEQDQVFPLLSISDLFLLPSAQESFGLAALEAMACEVPVIASRVGGLPEVIAHDENGFLHAPDDLDGMARSGVMLLTDERLHRRVAGAARRTVHQRFCDVKIVPVYEAYYQEILARD